MSKDDKGILIQTRKAMLIPASFSIVFAVLYALMILVGSNDFERGVVLGAVFGFACMTMDKYLTFLSVRSSVERRKNEQ